MNRIKIFLSMALLSWFIAISISLIIGILFLTEQFRDGVPTVIISLWSITIFALPVYAVFSFFPKKFFPVIAASLVLIIQSYLFNIITLPKPDSITFISSENPDNLDEHALEDTSVESVESEMPDMSLPDEL